MDWTIILIKFQVLVEMVWSHNYLRDIWSNRRQSSVNVVVIFIQRLVRNERVCWQPFLKSFFTFRHHYRVSHTLVP